MTGPIYPHHLRRPAGGAATCPAYTQAQVAALMPEGWWIGDDVPGANLALVPTWAEHQGSGRDWTQTDASAQPAKWTNYLNGHTVIHFGGNNTFPDFIRWMEQPPAPFCTTKATVFMVLTSYTDQSDALRLADFDGAGLNRRQLISFYRPTGGKIDLYWNGDEIPPVQVAAGPNWNNGAAFQVVELSDNNGWKDGAKFGPPYGASELLTYQAGARLLHLGTGRDSGFGENLYGEIAEIIWFTYTLYDPVKCGVRQYLGNKYAVPVAA